MEKLNKLAKDLSVECDKIKQETLIAELKQNYPDNLEQIVCQAMITNPFLSIDFNALVQLEAQQQAREATRNISILRQLAGKLSGIKVAIFCMLKSGSSFTQSAIRAGLNLPFFHLTSCSINPSLAGMNGREQELDELAIMFAVFNGKGNFIAQHHTCFTPYLGRQLAFYGILPIVTIRNVFDAIVSYDDMVMNECDDPQIGLYDGWAMLPRNYPVMDKPDRLRLISQNVGVWLIKFYLSWKRGIYFDMCKPLVLHYEEDILDRQHFVEKISAYLSLGAETRTVLGNYVLNPNSQESRINKGIAGRGAEVPSDAISALIKYAELFAGDLNQHDMEILFGTHYLKSF